MYIQRERDVTIYIYIYTYIHIFMSGHPHGSWSCHVVRSACFCRWRKLPGRVSISMSISIGTSRGPLFRGPLIISLYVLI